MFHFLAVICCIICSDGLKASTDSSDNFHTRSKYYYYRPESSEIISLIIDKGLKINRELREMSALDIGCGTGKLVKILLDIGFNGIQGIDIDPLVIEQARKEHETKSKIRQSRFRAANILDVTLEDLDTFCLFSLFTLFHVAAEFQFKKPLLKQLYNFAAPNAILILVDFIHRDPTQAHSLSDYEKNKLHPLLLTQLKSDFDDTGWEEVYTTDMTAQFIEEYTQLEKACENLLDTTHLDDPLRESIVTDHTDFKDLRVQLEAGILGGIGIIARKKILASPKQPRITLKSERVNICVSLKDLRLAAGLPV